MQKQERKKLNFSVDLNNSKNVQGCGFRKNKQTKKTFLVCIFIAVSLSLAKFVVVCL